MENIVEFNFKATGNKNIKYDTIKPPKNKQGGDSGMPTDYVTRQEFYCFEKLMDERFRRIDDRFSAVDKRIDTLDKDMREIRSSVDKLQYWIMGLMVATIGTLVSSIVVPIMLHFFFK